MLEESASARHIGESVELGKIRFDHRTHRFGEDVLETMLAWTDQLLRGRESNARQLSILDLGTGNGLFAIRLADLGYQNLTGCDYSAASIELAHTIADKSGQKSIQWVQDDLLESGISKRYFFMDRSLSTY